MDHLLREHTVTYWCPAGVDPHVAMTDRAVILGQSIDSRLAIEANTDSSFDTCSDEIKAALKWLIQNIRKYPGVSYTTAASAWNAEWSDSLFTFDRLVSWVQLKIGGVTWDQAKTYIINHYFRFVDYGA